MSQITRFDLEQQIMECWSVVDDIKTFMPWVYDSPRETMPSEDDQMNYLIGLTTIYQVKFERLFETYEKCIKQGEL